MLGKAKPNNCAKLWHLQINQRKPNKRVQTANKIAFLLKALTNSCSITLTRYLLRLQTHEAQRNDRPAFTLETLAQLQNPIAIPAEKCITCRTTSLTPTQTSSYYSTHHEMNLGSSSHTCLRCKLPAGARRFPEVAWNGWLKNPKNKRPQSGSADCFPSSNSIAELPSLQNCHSHVYILQPQAG